MNIEFRSAIYAILKPVLSEAKGRVEGTQYAIRDYGIKKKK